VIHRRIGSRRSWLTTSALSSSSRERLITWMVSCKTGRDRFRAGLPPDWRVGDKTGTGYRGAANDVAIAWPPRRGPILVASYMSDSNSPLAILNSGHAELGRLVAQALYPTPGYGPEVLGSETLVPNPFRTIVIGPSRHLSSVRSDSSSPSVPEPSRNPSDGMKTPYIYGTEFSSPNSGFDTMGHDSSGFRLTMTSRRSCVTGGSTRTRHSDQVPRTRPRRQRQHLPLHPRPTGRNANP
jgi:hypothetical protein